MRRAPPLRLSDFCGCTEIAFCELHAPELPHETEYLPPADLYINPERIVRHSEGHVYFYLDEHERQLGEACGLPLERLDVIEEPENSAYPEPEELVNEASPAPRLSLANSARFSSETEEEAEIEDIAESEIASSSSSSSWHSGSSRAASYQSLEDFIDFSPEFNTSGAFDFSASEMKGSLSAKLNKFSAGSTRAWFAEYTNENLGARLKGSDFARRVKRSRVD